MAIATPESYADMLDRAKAGKYAVPAINVTSSQTLSAALKGFADAESDGIVQISNGGAAYWSGSSRLDRVKGSMAFTTYARVVGDLYPLLLPVPEKQYSDSRRFFYASLTDPLIYLQVKIQTADQKSVV